MEQKFDPSPLLEAFLAAEVRNEREGGTSPTTLATSVESLAQMPADVLRDLNGGTAGADHGALTAELEGLISRFGWDFQVEEHVDPQAGVVGGHRR